MFMDQLLLNKKGLFKKFLIIFLPTTCVLILLSWGIYYFQHIKTQKEILLAKELNLINAHNEFVRHTIKSIISDINVIASGRDLQDIIIHSKQKDGSQLTTEFLSLSKYKRIYDQVRVLDNTGMEIIRVDLRGKTPLLVPANKLQFKGLRYYFKDTHKLNKDEIFMSPIDLNIERGKIELPIKPMIRFGMPIFGQDGKKQGVLILNYLGKSMIEDLHRLSSDSQGHLILLNSDGYWMKGMKSEDEWGFMFEDRNEKKFQYIYPSVWKTINQNEHGQLFNKLGLFTFTKVYPMKEGVKSSTGSPKPFQKSVRNLNSDEYFWIIISHVLPHELYKKGHTFIQILIITDLLLILFIGFILWQLIITNAKRQLAEDALKKINQKLEEEVRQRTEELLSTNISLKMEIEEHKKSVDEKLKIESQLRQAQKMEAIGNLAGGIAHDFNNILTPILGYTEMVKMQLTQDSPLYKDMNIILAASNRAKDLVQQILSFSHQTGQVCVPLKIQFVIEEAIQLLRSSIPKTIEIQTSIAPNCRAVQVDPTQIHQVVMNLCTNAYHAMRIKGGILGVSLYELKIGPDDYQTHFQLKQGDYLKLEVSDTGRGINDKLLEKIFEPYFTTKEKGDGTGLGLSVVHGIIKSLHGHIAVYSELEIGTTFHIYLPIVESKTKNQDTTLKEEMPKGTENILIVDDEESILRFEKSLLEKLGYNVTATIFASEALKIFQSNPNNFDLVITDMTMPKMTGAELIKKLNEYRPGIPTILCTGFSEIMSADRAKALGINKYITKPIVMINFAKTVRDVLDEKSI